MEQTVHSLRSGLSGIADAETRLNLNRLQGLLAEVRHFGMSWEGKPERIEDDEIRRLVETIVWCNKS